MRWINKRDKHNRKKAHQIVNRFLGNSWNENSGCYVNCNYDTFKNIKRFKSLLYHEQEGYCCYCMRKLNLKEKGKSTIEHVMPYKVNNRDVAFYEAYVPHLRKNVRPLLISKETPRLKHYHPYPHFCAYENLVLSCSGLIYKTDNPSSEYSTKLHECCNNPRGTKRVIPMFFYKTHAFDYELDGTLSFPSQYEESIKALRLETTDNLCLIRKAWASIVKYHTANDVAIALEKPDMREDILMDTSLTTLEARRLKHDLYWQLLYEYQWFDGYFRKKFKLDK